MQQQKKYLLRFLVNNLLILTGIVMIISGFVIQLGFHMGGADRHLESDSHSQTTNIEQLREVSQDSTVWGIDYSTWSVIHKTAIVLLSLLMIYHFVIHWKWYKAVLAKHLVKKNIQVITLSFLFIMVALTGLIPWFIDLSGSKSTIRLVFIEVHDKITILLTIYLILHIVKRARWFTNTFEKLKKSKLSEQDN